MSYAILCCEKEMGIVNESFKGSTGTWDEYVCPICGRKFKVIYTE